MLESDILHEDWPYWVCEAKAFEGFEVYRQSATHSVRVARIGYTGAVGMEKAKTEIRRRKNAELV